MTGADLTPFPDGLGPGYMEYAWEGLSPAQREVLMDRAGYRERKYRYANTRTWAALRSHRVISEAPSINPTERGRALADWAVRAGRWPS